MPMSLQVVLYAAALAMVVLAAVVINVLLGVKKQLDRIVSAVEHAESEITPLAREARIVFYRVGNLTDQTQRIVDGASSVVLPPVLMARRVVDIVRTGAYAFFKALASRPPRESRT